MHKTIVVHAEFAKVIACKHCYGGNLLRDDQENVPQPGYVGSNYIRSRVLLVGQNPGIPSDLVDGDQIYTAALRSLRDNPTGEEYEKLSRLLENVIQGWPVHNNYFPLADCGLTLKDIAYCNLVRCRTLANRTPNKSLVTNCVDQHFDRWIDWLDPLVVVFIGKWAFDAVGHAVDARGIPADFMNRQRSLSGKLRDANRKEVVEIVKRYRAYASDIPA